MANFFDINHELNFNGKLNKNYDKFNVKNFKKDKNEDIYGIFYGDVSSLYFIIFLYKNLF
jgi:hypothetical protein